jgi:hypothetical protein
MTDDPRRQKPVAIEWDGMTGRLIIDDEFWGAIEWSDKRKAFCIEDAEGQCLRHKASIRGQAAAKDEAIALAQAMILDGRMPSPEEAKRQHKEQVRIERERRAKQPAEIRRRELREERDRLWNAELVAESEGEDAEEETPLYELVIDTLDLSNQELWKSNSFAVLRARMITTIRAAIARLEYELHRYQSSRAEAPETERRLARARELLAQLGPDDGNPLTKEDIEAAYKEASKRSYRKDVRSIVFDMTRYGDDPRFKGLAGDKTLWNAVKRLLEAEKAK